MTLPLTRDRGRPAPEASGTLRPRPKPRPTESLALGRLRRAVRRQFLLFIVATALVAAAGIAYDVTGGLRPIPAATFWLPLAFAAGLAAALVRELGRNTVTSLSSLGKHRGYGVFGAAPDLTPANLRQMPPDRRTPLDWVVFQPASPFASAFRDLQSALRNDKLVAFVAALPGEGATTTALATAASAAQQGRNVIIVDCDLRGRTLTRLLIAEPREGVLESCEAAGLWRRCVVEEPETGFHLLPAARPRSPWMSLTGARGLGHLFAELRDAYDLVILDCAPALGSAEGSVIASMAEKCVLVTAWDRTPIAAVRTAMRALHGRSHVSTGVFVNRVPPGYRFGRLRPS